MSTHEEWIRSAVDSGYVVANKGLSTGYSRKMLYTTIVVNDDIVGLHILRPLVDIQLAVASEILIDIKIETETHIKTLDLIDIFSELSVVWVLCGVCGEGGLNAR